MTGRGKGQCFGRSAGALLAAAPSAILCAISTAIRDFIFDSIALTILVARREGALA
jgi:hypothetical protein